MSDWYCVWNDFQVLLESNTNLGHVHSRRQAFNSVSKLENFVIKTVIVNLNTASKMLAQSNCKELIATHE